MALRVAVRRQLPRALRADRAPVATVACGRTIEGGHDEQPDQQVGGGSTSTTSTASAGIGRRPRYPAVSDTNKRTVV
jgi:hypothetical protein